MTQIARSFFAPLILIVSTAISGVAQQKPEPIPDGPGHVVRWTDLKVEGADAYKVGKCVLFSITDADTKKLVFARLNNTIKAIYPLGGDKSKPLKLKQTPKEWTIHLDKVELGAGSIVVLEFTTEPYLPTEPWISKPAEDKSVTLPANHAVVHGELLQFEPLPHKNTVGYWVKDKDWAEWHFQTDVDATYTVRIFQGCGKGQGGSVVAMLFGEKEVEFTVEDTGHFQNFKHRDVGEITLPNGKHVVQLRVKSKAKNAVMDIREIKLSPKQ